MDGTRWTLAELDARFERSRARAEHRRDAVRRLSARRHLRGAVALLGLTMFAAAVAVAASRTEAESVPPPSSAKAATPREHVVYALPAQCRVPRRFQRAFLAASRDTGIPLSLLVSVAYEESRMNPRALSHAGALGLLQLLPSTAAELRLDAARPKTNILAGARYLRRMLMRFGDTTLALSAYNAGPQAVVLAAGAPSGAVLTYAANIEARAQSLAVCDSG